MTAGDTSERDALNTLSNTIIGCALQVHSELGPGLLESAYEACLTFELLGNQLHVERQVAVINFNVVSLRQGIKRVVNGFPE